MKKGLKIYKVDFKGVYPVGNCLIIAATNLNEAKLIASQTIIHTNEFSVFEVKITKPQVIEYLSGDY